MNLDNLYKSDKEDLRAKLKALYIENKGVISYFKNIDKSVKKWFQSDDLDTGILEGILEKISDKIQKLSTLKFEITVLQDEVPEKLQKKWYKITDYVYNTPQN